MLIIGILAGLIGISLGLLGGGGSILAVPILVYAADLPAKEAIATSLLVVGTTSAFALIPHTRAGNVEWRTGAIFSATAMIGAYLGGLAAGWFSGTTLLLLFAGIMIITALAMFRGKGEIEASGKSASVVIIILEGLVVGGATGLVGAGGGFLVVPALVLFGGMNMHKAVGTSLMVITLKSFAAFAGHASHVTIDFELALTVSAGAVVGSFIGAAFSSRIPADALRKGFSVFVLLMAAYVIWKELGPMM